MECCQEGKDDKINPVRGQHQPCSDVTIPQSKVRDRGGLRVSRAFMCSVVAKLVICHIHTLIEVDKAEKLSN